MTAPVFVDSNVVVYRFDRSEPAKHARAREWFEGLWETRAGRVSTQVLHESYSTLTRKLRMPRGEVRQVLRALEAWGPVALDHATLERAWHLEDRWSLPWWDSLIVAAALAAGARYLLSEDFQHGQDFDGIEVIDPFSLSPELILPTS
jgi:predicted nucleic acid-binding protein